MAVFNVLVLRCIKLQYGGEQSQNEAWNWLAANQLSSIVTTKESRFVWLSGNVTENRTTI